MIKADINSILASNMNVKVFEVHDYAPCFSTMTYCLKNLALLEEQSTVKVPNNKFIVRIADYC